jgi:hypothetical protein
MKSDKPILFLTNGLILLVSFIALFGFLSPLASVLKIVWEIFFLVIGLILVNKVCKANLFMLSVFYSANIIIMIALKLFVDVSGIALVFYIISLVLMSLGIVSAVSCIGCRQKKKYNQYKMMKEKNVNEIKQDVDEAFDNIAASNIEVEKYYDNIKAEKNSAKKKSAKKKAVKKSAKKKR